MSDPTLRFRQVHQDFHTSPHIEGIGADFDPDQYADTLAKAHINSISTFARCHHGWLYYQSKANPERIHPHLARPNLLIEQIEACHKRDIRVPIYTTVQWDDFTADEHPEWLMVDEDGTVFSTPPLKPGFYRFCDVLHPGYRQFLKDHTRELFETMPVDGLFYDIVQPRFSLTRHWLDAMDNAGIDPEDPEARQQFATRVIDEWKLEMTEFIKSLPEYTDDCTIFYNAGHVGPRHRSSTDAYTHYELESLPSGGWGYTHFPLAMRYARGLGKDCLGMTGKFHTSWGDFHSYKNPAALQFECFHMLALGAKCSIGDQLHPSGLIDSATYSLIGDVYASVKEKEPWCADAVAVSEVGVVTPEEFAGQKGSFLAAAERQPFSAIGAARMLQELRIQFDFITSDRDFGAYKLIILPDSIPVGPELAGKLRAYLAKGGKVIASYMSGLEPTGETFACSELGVSRVGDAPFSPDFIVPEGEIGQGLPATGHVMYNRGLQVEPVGGAEVLSTVQTPYFNRTWRHFCSHAHTPSSGKEGYAGIVGTDDTIYFAHPIFKQYHDNAPRWCKTLLSNAIRMLIGEPMLTVDGPSTLLTSLMHQPAAKRHVLHLLHYLPERRGQAFDVIEDIIPLYTLPVSLTADAAVSSVKLVPGGEPIDFEQKDGRVSFIVPKVEGHAMIEIA